MGNGRGGAVPSSRDGFTLIEVLVALSVVAVAVVGLLGMVVMATGQDENAADQNAAMDAAMSLISEIRQTPFHQVYSKYKDHAFPVEGLNPWPGDPDGLPGRVVIDASDPDLLDIQVIVEWSGQSGSERIMFRTLRGPDF